MKESRPDIQVTWLRHASVDAPRRWERLRRGACLASCLVQPRGASCSLSGAGRRWASAARARPRTGTWRVELGGAGARRCTGNTATCCRACTGSERASARGTRSSSERRKKHTEDTDTGVDGRERGDEVGRVTGSPASTLRTESKGACREASCVCVRVCVHAHHYEHLKTVRSCHARIKR